MTKRAAKLGTAAVLCALAVTLLAGFGAAPDVVRLRPATKRPPELPIALFSHEEHRPIGCHGCHPGLFSTPRPRVTHAAMKVGHYCGACHDGKRAAAVAKLECRSCHAK
jgi:c(7)-type cytochrome triheme protein